MGLGGVLGSLFDAVGRLALLRDALRKAVDKNSAHGARAAAAGETAANFGFWIFAVCIWLVFACLPSAVIWTLYRSYHGYVPWIPEGGVAAVCVGLPLLLPIFFFRRLGGVVTSIILFGVGIGFGAWQHDALAENADTIAVRVGCQFAKEIADVVACLDRFPDPVLVEWRQKLGAHRDSLVASADRLLRVAASPSSAGGYSQSAFDAASPALDDLAAFDATGMDDLMKARRGALRLGVGAFEDCAHCPSLRIVLPAEARLPFAIGEFEISVAEWKECENASVCSPMPEQDGSLPVINVTAQAVRQYLDFVSRQSGHTYRLPTEAEWRFAATGRADGDGVALRQGGVTAVCAIANSLNRDAPAGQAPPASGNPQCEDRFAMGELAPSDPTTFPQGTRGFFLPNQFGLYHTVGNASEWTQDSCVLGTAQVGRTVLGGANTDTPNVEGNMLVVEEGCSPEYYGNPNRGFRVLRELN